MKKSIVGILAHVDAGKTTRNKCLLKRGEIRNKQKALNHRVLWTAGKQVTTE